MTKPFDAGFQHARESSSLPDTTQQSLFSEVCRSASDLGRAAVYTGVAEPVLGVTQIVDQVAGTRAMASVANGLAEFGISAPDKPTGSLDSHAQMLGNALGMLLPYLALHKMVRGVAVNKFGEEAFAAPSPIPMMARNEFATTVAKEAALSFTTGFTYDAVFRPSSHDQSENFLQARMMNGLAGGTVMAALTASSLGLNKLGTSEAITSRWAKTVLTNPMSAGVISAIPSGLAGAEVDALRHSKLLPTTSEVGQNIYQMGFIGLTLGGAHFLKAQRDTHAIGPERNATFRTGEITELESPKQRADRLDLPKDMELSKDLFFAKINDLNGSRDVVIRPFDNTPRSMMRVYRAEVSERVNNSVKNMTGVDSPSLPMVLRNNVDLPTMTNDYDLGPIKNGPVIVQENGGKQLGSQLREWAKQASGQTEPGEPPAGGVTKLINENSEVRALIGRAAFDNMYKGNVDLVEFSQQTIKEGKAGVDLKPSGKLTLVAVDNKNDFTLLEKPSWGFGAQFGLSLEVAKALEGRRLLEVSPELQSDAEAIKKVFSSQAGRQQLLRDGLTTDEINAAVSRLNGLVLEGFPKHLGDSNYYADEAEQQLTASLHSGYDDEAEGVRRYLASRDQNLTVIAQNGHLSIGKP